MGSKSLFCFRKSEICILNTVSAEVTLAPSNLAFRGSILHILFSSSRHCLTFTCGHQKRFTNGNVWTRINLKTDKYLSVFKFIRIRVDGASTKFCSTSEGSCEAQTELPKPVFTYVLVQCLKALWLESQGKPRCSTCLKF